MIMLKTTLLKEKKGSAHKLMLRKKGILKFDCLPGCLKGVCSYDSVGTVVVEINFFATFYRTFQVCACGE